MSGKAKEIAVGLLQQAGITVDGNNPWDIQVHDERLWARVMGGGSLGLGESYMDGWWDTASIDQFIYKVFEAQLERRVKGDWQALLVGLRCRYTNPQVIRRAYEIGKRHYDTGNDLFEIMLDKRLIYSCGYWRRAENLDQAQEAKLDLICRKLELEPGMTLLDIGCGWGGLLQYAAEHYGVEGVGVTVSRQQAELAAERCRDLPVTIKLEDYRSVSGAFDRVASVGMVEHVGWRNYPTFMEVAHRSLKPGGLFLLHTIGSNWSDKSVDPWVERYIFPNSMLPSLSLLSSAAEPYFIAEDLHNFGPYYDRTLLEWDQRFREGWPQIAERYGERFFRMWRFYLLSSAASFRVRRIQLWQLLLSKGPRPGPVNRIE